MGPPKKSKRARKQKDKHSLKYKRNATPANVADGLQEALASVGAADAGRKPEFDSNAAILPAEPTAAAAGEGEEEAAPAKQLSKSQQRKLRRIQEEKERKEKRVEVLQALSQHQLKSEQLQLLRPVAQRGQRETKKQALKRALQLERAGLQVPEDVRLVQERPRMGLGSGSESEGDSDSEGRAAPAAAPARGAGVLGPQGKAPARGGGSSSGSSESDEEEGGSSSEDEGAAKPPSKKPRLDAATGGASAAATGAAPQQQQQQAAAAAPSPAEQRAQAAAAAAAIMKELGVKRGEEEEEAAAAAQRGQQGMGGPEGKVRVVLVQRRPDIQEVREGLPITGQEQEVMESVLENDVVVLCGETGCGKTTQVPQFLFEAGFGCKDFPERAGAIGVTQPRRVAAISTAERVADELNTKLGHVVGYQVRYDKRVGEGTAIKFMTDGILLRELQSDFLLRRYSAIVVDEAHERSLNTDILLGMLSRIVRLRRQLWAAGKEGSSGSGGEERVYPLKLIIMSATLRTEDFVANRRLFAAQPPLVSVPARQFPVTVHFSKRTELHDYVGAAFRKVCQIHRSLPPGGILVFLTGQREVEHLCAKLRATFAPKKKKKEGGQGAGAAGQQQEEEGARGATAAADEGAALDAFSCDAAEADAAAEAGLEDLLLDDRLGASDMHDDYDAESSGDEEEVVVMGGEGFTPEEIAAAEKDFERRLGIDLSALKSSGGGGSGGADGGAEREAGPVHVLPLYAMLPPAQQARVFRPGPPGARTIVVATNVAETSLTIPGIRYVVDAGRSKQRILESAAGLARYEVRWVSKASAEQRAGRAGRTGPGHCYRLFSSAHFNDTFPQHSPPEIVNTALEGVVLAMKALGVDKVPNFPFPSPPEPEALAAAERCLVALSALDPASGQLTALGRAMAAFPISPRHARMLLEAAAQEAGKQGAAAAEAAAAAAEGQPAKKRKKAKAGGEGGGGAGLLRYAVALAAALSVDSPFVHVDSIQAEAGTAAGDDGPEAAAAAKEKANAARQAARQAHSQFRVGDSDALSALRALCAFEAAGEDQGFCKRNHLHWRNLREAAALRKQLAHTLAQQGQSQAAAVREFLGGVLGTLGALAGVAQQRRAGGSAEPELPPLTPLSMEALRKALAAGWADQVAKRVRALEYVKTQAAQGHKSRAVRYRSCALDEDVFLHPNSALHSASPELVVYTELVRTAKRPYMAGLTAIEPRWLPEVAAPLCTFSDPLDEPAPTYRTGADKVVCWRGVTFGKHDWQLPPAAGPHPDATERCAIFGAALLQGKVLPAMQGLRKALAVPPSMLLRPDTRVHRRVADLLQALVAAGVDSRASLARKWEKAPTFLQAELVAWVQKAQAQALLGAWPQLLRECGVGAAR